MRPGSPWRSDADYPATEKGSMRSFPASPTRGGSGQRPVLKVPITQEKVYGVDFLFACMGRVRYVSNYSTYTGVGRQTKRDAHFEHSFNISRDGEIIRLKWYLFIDFLHVSLITMIKTLRLPRWNASQFTVNYRARPGNFQCVPGRLSENLRHHPVEGDFTNSGYFQ